MNSIKQSKNGYKLRTEIKKEKIVNTAKEMLKKNKQGKLNMDNLAQISGMAKMSIYNYFDSKSGLLDYILLDILDSEFSHIKKVMDSDESFKEKLTKYMLIKYQFIADGYMPLLNTAIKSSKTTSDKFTVYQNESYKMVLKLIEQGKNEGEIDENISQDIILSWMKLIVMSFENDKSLMIKMEKDSSFFIDFIMVFWRGLQKNNVYI